MTEFEFLMEHVNWAVSAAERVYDQGKSWQAAEVIVLARKLKCAVEVYKVWEKSQKDQTKP